MTPLDFARADLGVSSVGGRFRGPPFDKYALEGEPPLAWCARAVRTWFALAGKTLPGDPYQIGSVANLHDALVAAGMFVSPSSTPRPNDLILLLGTAGNADGMLIGGHHVGLVDHVDDTYVYSIDGDWGTPDRVQPVRRLLDADDIWGYGRVVGAGGAGSLAIKGAAAFGAVKLARFGWAWWRRRKGGA